ncbi:MAG: MauE/DoxX family redox-associated membrane protein [Anaerolineales bacterium]|jgi:thiosulfate dehydrogenase [quinone] large subunit
MEGIFGILTVSEWLAILRIGVGLWWLKSFLHKPHREFVNGQMANWTLALADNNPSETYGKLIKRLIEPNKRWFPYLILFGELSVALGLIFGFLTPLALIGAVFMNLNYLSLAGVKPTKDKSVNPCYQCEQGQNWNMILSEVVMLFTAAWSVWSIDALIGLFPTI